MFRDIRRRWKLFRCAALGHDFGRWERYGLRMFYERWCSRCGRRQLGVKARGGKILPAEGESE